MPTKLREEQNQLMTWSQVVLAVVAVGFVLYVTRAAMIPFVLAVFVASLASPIVDFQIVRWKVSRWLAVTSAMIIVMGVIVAFCLMLIVATETVLDTVEQYTLSVSELSDRFFDQLHQIGVIVEQDKISAEIKEQLPTAVAQTFGTITQLIVNGMLIFVFIVFLLTGRSRPAPVNPILLEIDAKVRKYLWIRVLASTMTGLLVGFILWMLGMPLAFVFGILTFLLNFIPMLGSYVATLLPIPLAVAHFDSSLSVLAVVALPGAVQITIGNFIEPRLQGIGLKLHPVVLLLALALWGLLWGIPGMVLAAPITAIIRIVLMQFETTRPFGRLLVGQLPQVVLKDEDSS